MLPKSINVTTQEQAREVGREFQRRNIIEATIKVLRAEGAAAVTTRRIAQELDCSTKVIYTLFGGKEGLADALYREGFGRLHAQIVGVQPVENPATYLRGVANAYRQFALENPHEYGVMFGESIPQFKPNAESLAVSIHIFMDIVQVTMTLPGQDEDSPEYVIKAFWALLHGMMSLHLAGHLHDPDAAVFDYAVRIFITGLFPSSSNTGAE